MNGTEPARERLYCLGRYEKADAVRSFATDVSDLERLLRNEDSGIVQGAGLSLSGAGFGPHSNVVSARRLNQVLDFAPEDRIIEVGAGATLGELFAILGPHGLAVPVQPGHPDITIGGCVAGDVHGKNPVRDGNFCDHVLSIELFHPDHGRMTLSPSENPDLFELTCGGFGMTGAILSVRLRLSHLRGDLVALEYVPVDGLSAGARILQARSENADFIYSWHDMAAPGRALGAGFVAVGRVVEGDIAKARFVRSYRPLRTAPGPGEMNILRPALMRPINALYRRLTQRRRTRRVDAFSAYFPWTRQSAYFRAFGRLGFVEHQALLRDDTLGDYMTGVTDIVRRSGAVPTLASLKAFSGAQRFLRFRGRGVSLSLHVPASAAGIALIEQIDALDDELGALPNIIKDSRLSAQAVRRHYDGYQDFRSSLRDHDPKRRFRSSLSERIGL
ncbi:MAG: dehydrogenase [Alphaproteobacteria bacterium]|nr:dehydrogenase [Alphaproteobacteria bacterium]